MCALGKSRISSSSMSLGSHITQNKQEQTGKICQSQCFTHICSLFLHLQSEQHPRLPSLCHSTEHWARPWIFSVLVAVVSSKRHLALCLLHVRKAWRSSAERNCTYIVWIFILEKLWCIAKVDSKLKCTVLLLSTETYCISLVLSFSRANRIHLYRVWVGLLDTIEYDKETHTFTLKQLIIHEKYNTSSYENDIALLELNGKGECSLAHSTPACVPWSQYMFRPGDTCKVSGWGLEKGICLSAHYKNVLFESRHFLIAISFYFDKPEEQLCTKPSGEAEYNDCGLWFGIQLSLWGLFSVQLPLLFQPLGNLLWRTPLLENHPKKCSICQSKTW